MGRTLYRYERWKVFRRQGFLFKQQMGTGVQIGSTTFEQRLGSSIGFIEQGANTQVDFPGCLFRIVFITLRRHAFTQVRGVLSLQHGLTELGAHAKPGDQLLRDICCVGQVIGSSSGNLAISEVFGSAPGHPDFFLACGFVGHGFMMAPIVGKLYAEWLTGGTKHEIFERYTLARFADGSAAAHEKEDFNIG